MSEELAETIYAIDFNDNLLEFNKKGAKEATTVKQRLLYRKNIRKIKHTLKVLRLYRLSLEQHTSVQP